jgi:hypothetical protein
MRNALRFFLAIIAMATGLLSLLSLFWWFLVSLGFLVHGGSLGLPPQSTSLPGVSTETVAYMSAYLSIVNYLFIFGGALGWVSLLALCQLHRRQLRQLPKWVLVGCGIGTLTIVALPAAHVLAYFPIACAVAVLLRCWLAGPNNSSKRTRVPRAA